MAPKWAFFASVVLATDLALALPQAAPSISTTIAVSSVPTSASEPTSTVNAPSVTSDIPEPTDVPSATSDIPEPTDAPEPPTSGGNSTTPSPGCPQNTNKFCLIFQDDFQTLNQNVWKHDITLSGGGNWEFEWYTNNRTNSFVKNGTLFLKPTLTADNIGAENVVSGTTMDLNGNEAGYHCTDAGFFGCRRTSDGTNIINPVQSARISTAESVAIQYGRVEVKAKLPKGDWIWPAIWLLPKRPTYGNWPASGEIDIMESRGNKPGNAKSPGYDTIGSTLHWGPSYQFNKFDLTHKEFKLPSGSFGDEFHTFGLEWTPDYLRTYVDEPTNVVLEVPLSKSFWDKGGFPTSINNPWEDQCTAAPFDQEFYLILNVAVGGTASYFPDDAGDNKPWKNTAATAAKDFWDAKDQWYKTWEKDDVAMKVDSVKMWKMC